MATSPPKPAINPVLGQGSVPLAAILDALPADIPLSIEWSRRGRDSDYTAAEWEEIALDGTREFMEAYYAESSRR